MAQHAHREIARPLHLNRRSLSLFAAGALVGVLVATVGYALVERGQNASGAGALVLKLGHGLDKSHPVHLAMERMAVSLAEKSGGTVKLLIAPNGQLGTETECIELLQRGSLAMTKTSTAALEIWPPSCTRFTFYDCFVTRIKKCFYIV